MSQKPKEASISNMPEKPSPQDIIAIEKYGKSSINDSTNRPAVAKLVSNFIKELDVAAGFIKRNPNVKQKLSNNIASVLDQTNFRVVLSEIK